MTDYLCASCNEDGMVCIPRAELDRLRAENEKLRLMPDDNREQLFKVTAMAAQLNEENERLREAIRQYAGEINATQETDPDILRRMIEIERAQATEIQASLSNELDRLRAENKEFRLILEAILNGSGYHGYALAGRARAILAATHVTQT